METEVLKNFCKRDVEILVAGVWIEGHMTPIVKSVVTLLPVGEAAAFYGPTAVKAEVIQAIREVKRQPTTNSSVNNDPSAPPAIRSGFNPGPGQSHPGMRFVHPVVK